MTSPANDVSRASSKRSSGIAEAFVRTLFLLGFMADLFVCMVVFCVKANDTKEVFLLIASPGSSDKIALLK
jgi:hypothetical protein